VAHMQRAEEREEGLPIICLRARECGWRVGALAQQGLATLESIQCQCAVCMYCDVQSVYLCIVMQ
jgi:hypothetical protein